MSTLQRSRTAPAVADPGPQRKAARLATSGWLVMTFCSIYIVGVVGRYLTFDPDVYFSEQRETYIRLPARPRHPRGLRRPRAADRAVPVRAPAPPAVRAGAPGLRRRVRLFRHRARRVRPGPGPDGVHRSGRGDGLHPAGVGTLFTTWTALRMVLAHRYAEHRRWMTYSFSLIWAGVMLRIWTPIYGGLAGLGLVDFSFETAYAAIAWLCWVPNLLFALWLTRRTVEREPAR
jgi:hypothetical protein